MKAGGRDQGRPGKMGVAGGRLPGHLGTPGTEVAPEKGDLGTRGPGERRMGRRRTPSHLRDLALHRRHDGRGDVPLLLLRHAPEAHRSERHAPGRQARASPAALRATPGPGHRGRCRPPKHATTSVDAASPRPEVWSEGVWTARPDAK